MIDAFGRPIEQWTQSLKQIKTKWQRTTNFILLTRDSLYTTTYINLFIDFKTIKCIDPNML